MSYKNGLMGLILVMFSLTNCSADTSEKKINQDTLQPQFKISIDLDKVTLTKQVLPDSSTEWLDVSISARSRVDVFENYLFILNTFIEGSEYKVYDINQKTQIYSIDDKTIYDFTVDRPSKEVSLLIDDKTIRTITFEGKLIREFRLSDEVSEIRNLSTDKLIGYDNFRDSGSANFYIFDSKSGKKQTQYLPYKKGVRGLGWSVNTSLSRNKASKVYTAVFLSNFIYTINNNAIEKWVELDFGKNNADFEQFVAKKNESPFRVAMSNNWVYTIDKIMESDNSLICTIIKNGIGIEITLDKNDPTNWSISPNMNYVASVGNTFVSIERDKDSVEFEDGQVVTKRIKLQYFNH